MRVAGGFLLTIAALAACADTDICDVNIENCIQMPASEIIAVDGDTYQIAGRRLRLAGWDSPETGSAAKCRKEHELGLRAEAQAKLFIGTGTTATLQLLGQDQYKREVARIWLDGTDIGKMLNVDGLALPIHKDEVSAKADWCGSTS